MTRGADPSAESLAARLVVGLAGSRLTRREEDWLARWRPAGVILFARNVVDRPQTLALCAAVRARLGGQVEIVADHEGGAISVLADAVGRPPAPYGLGLAADPGLTRRVHAETAARLRAVGLTRALAPCADVLVQPRNAVIGTRAFGGAPRRVAEQVAAAVAGLLEGGIGVCLKHWPGHGGTAGDSHEAAVATGEGACEEPFLAGLAAGADAVMLGHLPDPRGPLAAAGPALPATLDPGAVARLRARAPERRLRLFADDITMGALRDPLAARGLAPVEAAPSSGLIDPEALTLAWLAELAAAGCDRLLCRGVPWNALPLSVAGPQVAGTALPGGRTEGVAEQGAGEAAAADAHADPAGREGGVYDEARRRLAAAGGGDPFPAAALRLLWLDATTGDRWGEAAVLLPLLRERFVITDPLVGSGCDAARDPASALLVTSHRPLAPRWLAELARPGVLAEGGGCLALGHPSLASDVRSALPPGWRLAYLPDLDAAMLRAVLGAAR